MKKDFHQQLKKLIVLQQKVLTSYYCEGNEAILLEVNAETDFVAKNESFQVLVQELARTSSC